jgi:rRNA-processing protein FCF1
MSQEKPSVSFTAEQLQEMLRTVLQEARKPADPTPAQIAELEAAQTARKQQAELVLAEAARKKAEQEACIHLRRDGTSTGVYVENGNYIICQQCQAIIRPETNLAMFNRLFQLSQSPATF